MTTKTNEADRSSPVTDTGNSMARAPTQDARVPRSHYRTESQKQPPTRGRREGLVPTVNRIIRSINQDHGEEHITQETSRETDVQNGASSQRMNRNIRKRDEQGHHNPHRKTHDERDDANVREDVGGGGANEGEEGEREVKEADGNGLSTSQGLRSSNPVRNLHRKGEPARVPGRHSRREQTHDERGDGNIREDADNGGANEGEGEGEREVKEAEGNQREPSTNQALRPSNKLHDRNRESARDAILRLAGHHNHHGQTRDEQVDANVREDVDDGGANEGEEGEGGREVKEEGNELSTNQGPRPSNQGLRPSNPVRRPYRRESARDAIYRLEGTLRSRENDVYVLSTRNEQLSDEIKIVKEELTRLQLERDQTRQLLHERTIELSSAQLFLGKADTISVTDVSRMVDILNAEISQASNSISDSLLDHQAAPAAPDTTELNRLLHKVQSSIGANLCGILARRLSQPSAEFDPMITQLVLQAGLSEACHLIINDWNPPLWDTSSTVIAGRWRSLTRTYTNGQAGQDSQDGIQVQDAKKKEIQEATADYLRSTLRDLLTIVGWSSNGPHHDLPSEYKEKMRFLSDEALKLHETIGRGITSKDLIVEIIPCETPFDPTKMDDADRQRGKPDAIPDDTVACTVELGLRYNCAKSGGDSEETGVILKPKVLLASVLVEEDREVAPPKPQN
ncbi:hypothetical protein JOM56_002870 [Amanita muscaria]